MYVCWAVRVALSTRPIALTSLKAVAHSVLVSAGGSGLRNCDELVRKNGRTPPTHGVGSRAGAPLTISGCQCPTAVLGTHWDGPKRPSFARSSSMALAAAWPIETPCLLNASLGIGASDAAYDAARELSRPARPGNGARSGAFVTRLASTSYAAVATAAFTEALAPVRMSR